MRIRLDVGYDGTSFYGWQVQSGRRTVQGELQSALCQLLHRKVSLIASGRTDAGVHARLQVVVFDIEQVQVPVEKIALALSSFLPDDIVVYSSSLAIGGFHPRKDCKEKVYRYFFNWGIRHPILNRYSLFVTEEMWNKIKALSWQFSREGRFSVFACNRGDGSHLSNRIWQVCVDTGSINERIGFVEFKSKGFLYKMVRRMVGLLLDIAWGRFPESVIEDIFAGKELEWNTAPAQGLFLWDVRY